MMIDVCEFCDKRGLPILPVRYAVAPAEARAPQLTASFEVNDTDGKPIPLAGHIHYTTRLLRSGYLYAYDEARQRWAGYFVTDQAYFLRFEIDQPAPAAYAGRQPCDVAGHREVASCITVTDPKNASNVWVAFSDVEWTPEVLKLHADAGYRQRHMQKIDVKKALAGSPQKHVKKIAELAESVTEYAIDRSAGSRTYGLPPNSFHSRKTQCESTIRHIDAIRPGKSIILALHDPAGMAADIGAMMGARFDAFCSQKEHRHPLAVSSAILSLQESIRRQAEHEEIQAAEQLQAQTMAESPLLSAYPDRESV